MTRCVSTAHLIEILEDARSRTLELLGDLDGAQLIGPRLPTVNPMLWEVGHVAWFYENFILRRLYGHAPLLEQGDRLYDSIAIAHDTRWDLPLLPLDETLRYMGRVHEALVGRLEGALASEQDSFIYQFATFHEDMHDEAFLWTRQTLAYPRPRLAAARARAPSADGEAGGLSGDAQVPGGTFMLGAPPQAPFLFDNEKWAHPVELVPFRISRAPVSNGQFMAFVEDGGYQRREFWDQAGWGWREAADAHHPVYWRREGSGAWEVRQFDAWGPLAPDRPVVHVNWHEASAWCRWAGRRLPTEAEWEAAAVGEPDGGRLAPRKRRHPWGEAPPGPERANLDGRALGCVDVAALPAGDSAFGCRQMLGNVWEWTADTFGPYPGFAPDAYREYSQPLFGTTRVLRGGAWTSRARMVNATYRNYFGPERRDVFAGFRTCATAD